MNSATLPCVNRLEALLATLQPDPLPASTIEQCLEATFDTPLSGDGLCHGLAYDSRRVTPGSLFIALRGEKVDGHAYLRDAWERGARGAVVEHPDAALAMPQLYVTDSRRALSLLSDLAYRAPSRQLTTIGITGTKGKTSTSYFVRHLLEQGGHPTGVIGTLGWHVGGETVPLPLTTPESLELHQLLAALRQAGCSHVVMEASAHGVHFQRTRDVAFSRLLFTNLAQDHLDFFGTMETYGAAKARLFTEQLPEHPAAMGLINIDDAFGQQLASLLPAEQLTTVGTHAQAQVRGTLMEARPGQLRLRIQFREEGEIEALVPIGGAFFLTNLLLAAATAASLGVSLTAITTGLATMPAVPGRHEMVSTPNDDISVVVDYAHTPMSVAAILATVERDSARPVIALVGCGGDRDRSKRPQMGRLALDGADQVIVTSDNPRSEDPEAIIADILTGIPTEAVGQSVRVEVDREQAIASMIREAPAGARLFILGKGHEPYQILKDRTIAFDDREHARAALAARREARLGAAK